MARGSGFKVPVAVRGADALELARKYHPTAISLDVFLPDTLGWTELSQLKQDPATRHIPVQIVTLDEDRQHGLARGAFNFVTKPVKPEGLTGALERIKEYAKPRRRRLLVVEDDAADRLSIRALLERDDMEIETASSGEEALSSLRETLVDCAVLDLDSKCWSALAVIRRSATFLSWCSPARILLPKRMHGFIPSRAASS